MKKTIEELRRNGHLEMDGREYILTEQASFQCDPLNTLAGMSSGWKYNNYYSARAICLNDETDEDGYQKCYLARWNILAGYDPELDGEDCACDWESPVSVREHGEYSLETGCYY